MDVDDILNLALYISFNVLALITLLDYLRRRDGVRRDIHLMFASVAGILLLQLVGRSTGLDVSNLTLYGMLALLAHPHFMLRLAAHHRQLPTFVHAASLVGMLVSWSILIVMPSLGVAGVVPILIYFVGIEGYASWSLVQGALTTGGVSQRRLRFAAFGSLGLALALLAVGLGTIAPALAPVSSSFVSLLGILSAAGYYLGFATPAWLSRSWQLEELHRFRAGLRNREERLERPWVLHQVSAAAVRSVGATDACVALWDEASGRLHIAAATSDKLSGEIPVDGSALGDVWRNSRGLAANVDSKSARSGRWSEPELHLAASLAARTLLAVPVVVGESRVGVLAVFRRAEPLFPDADLELLTHIAEQGAVLLSYQELMADQVKLVAELRRSNAELERATRMKSEFLANMSHELRTPLNAIIGFAQLMHDEKVGPIAPDHKEYLGDILSSADHLLQLVNDVLDLSKIEAGKMEFHPETVDVGKVVGEVRDILRSLAAQKRLHVEVDVNERVQEAVVDPAKLKQILYNYLSNAIKFTPEGGRITIRVVAAGEAHFRLEVADTGIGIAPENLHRLFQEFQQLDTGAAKQYQGTGLGLTLTKRIVEAQGGRVGVRSRPGEGSTFFAELPRRPSAGDPDNAGSADDASADVAEVASYAPPEQTASRTTGSGSSGTRILVVEDNRSDREWLVQTLLEHGYSVETAATGTEALARVRNQAYDAVTLDLLLPDMSGLDILQAIRASETNRDVPVVVVTVVAEKGAVAGYAVHDYLTKPLQSDELLAALSRAGVRPHGHRRVLVVDDDRATVKLITTALTSLGYDPVAAYGGREALQIAAAGPPEAIILDLMMPEMDGLAFLYHLRSTQSGAAIPVVIWTAKELTDADRALIDASAQAVVVKGQGKIDDLVRELESLRRGRPERRSERAQLDKEA